MTGAIRALKERVLIREVVWALAVEFVVTIVSLAISDTGGNLISF